MKFVGVGAAFKPHERWIEGISAEEYYRLASLHRSTSSNMLAASWKTVLGGIDRVD